MKIICTKENLSQALSLVIGVAGKNVNLPILNNVLIKASEQKTEVVATNLELAITSQLRSKIEQAGSFTVPARTLNDFVNLLPDDKVELNVVKNELEVVCGKSATKIKGTPSDDFPVLPTVQDGSGYLIDASVLQTGLGEVSPSVSRNDIRPELSGVSFNFINGGKTLLLAATDSYRLAEKKISSIQGEVEKQIIVPLRAVLEISRLLSVCKEDSTEKHARFIINENQAVLRYNGAELITRLIEGQYPDYTQIIPKEFGTEIVVSASQLTKEVKAASLFTTTGVNAVTFDIQPDKGMIVISSVSTQTGEYKSELSAEIKGPANQIFLNHRYVLEGLNNISTANCRLRIVSGDSPCMLVPEGDGKGDYVYIIMPIRQ